MAGGRVGCGADRASNPRTSAREAGASATSGEDASFLEKEVEPLG